MQKFYIRINAIMLVAAMLLSQVPFQFINVAKAVEGGDGTYEDPYEISTCLELEALDPSLGGYYELTGDIDCSDSSSWNEGAGFNPIDYFETDSVLLGHGYTISTLTMNRPEETNVGLFANMNGAILDVNFVDVDITGSNEVGVIGRISSGGTVAGVTVSGEITGSNYVGGIVGFMNYGNVLKSSVDDIVLNSTGSAGGIVGHLAYGGTVYDSYANVTITANYGGGIIGYAEGNSDEIYNVWVAGSISGSLSAGGLVGTFYNSNMTLMNSFSAAELSGGGQIGGINGATDGGWSYIQNVGTYFDENNAGTTSCVGNVSGGTFDTDDCYSWDSLEDPTYLVGNSTDAPVVEWDFDNVWETSMVYPQLQGGTSYSVPSVPLNFQIVEAADNEFELTWDTPEDLGGLPLLEYNIQVDVAGEDFNYPMNDIAISDESYTLYNNYNGAELSVRINAANLLGNSEWVSEDFTVSEGDTHEISTCEELQAIHENSEYDTYVLVNDIDCTGFDFEPLGGEWNFRGLLDGAGYSIINLSVDVESSYAGLFKYMDNGVVRDLTFESPTIVSTNDNVGVLVGYAEDAIIDNVDVTGGSVEGQYSVGGLIGLIETNSYITVKDSSFDGSVEGVDDVGGIIGYLDGDYAGTAVVKKNVSHGSVTASGVNAGGLIGYMYAYGDDDEAYFYVIQSYSDADVSAVYGAGGLIGEVYAEAYDNLYFLIEDSYAAGNVSGTESIGGLVGFVESYYEDEEAYIEFNRVYASGTVTGTTSVGGLIGYLEGPDDSYERVLLLHSFATGVVTGTEYPGGLVGRLTGTLEEETDEENLYFADSTTQELCDDEENLSTCESTTLVSLYDPENEPYVTGDWDSEEVWYFAGDVLPVLYWDYSEEEPEEEEEAPRSGGGSSGSRVSKTDTTTSEGGTSYADEVKEVLEKKVVTENPDNLTNKCEALTIMSRVFNWTVPEVTSSKYTDVPEWCVSVAAYGTERGIVEGQTATTLGMKTPVTRYEMAVMLYRELQKQNYEFKGTNQVTFSDELIPWAKQAVEALAKEGVINGFANGTFGGEKGILKQDAAIMMLRFLKKKKIDYTVVDDSSRSSQI